MQQPPDQPTATACQHHWRIATPEGPTVRGVCRRCGAEHEFPTTTENNLWETGNERCRREMGSDDQDLF